MNRNIVQTIAWGILIMLYALSAAVLAQAQDAKTPYPSMAPLDQYLIADRNAEIALARSAAPPSISRDATVVVLGRHAYETAVKGKNGFVCIVERGWMNTFDNAEFWNPKNRSPVCYNPPAAQTILPITYMRTDLVLAGKSKAEIRNRMRAAFTKKKLPDLEPGAMCYMMSKDAYLTDNDGHNFAHIMFFTPVADGATLGADLPGSPVLTFKTAFNGDPDSRADGFMVGTGMWSDGSAAPTVAN